MALSWSMAVAGCVEQLDGLREMTRYLSLAIIKTRLGVPLKAFEEY